MDPEGQQSHARDGFSPGTGLRGWRGLLSNPLSIPFAAFSLRTSRASVPPTLSRGFTEKQGSCVLRT